MNNKVSRMMPTNRIDRLVWEAFTNPGFRARLLNGQRREVLNAFNLTETERQTVLAVEADTLEAFAEALCQPPEPMPNPGL
jgi:hypothetical protein